VQTICIELKVHTLLEEEIYYPAIRGEVDEADLEEAYVEHDAAKLLVNETRRRGARRGLFDAKVKVLKELVEHHVRRRRSSATICSSRRAPRASTSRRSALGWRRARRS
jgi:hypothetical protein